MNNIMGKSKKALKEFILNIPETKLTRFSDKGLTRAIFKNQNFRLEGHGVSNKDTLPHYHHAY